MFDESLASRNSTSASMQGVAIMFTIVYALGAISWDLFRSLRNPQTRRRTKRWLSEAFARLAGLINPAQKQRYRNLRVRQLKKELQELTFFRRVHEMDSFRKIFSNLAAVASNFLFLCVYILFGGILFAAWALVTLEKEILHLPVVSPHMMNGQLWVLRLAGLLFVLLISLVLWNASKVQVEADKLSPIFRRRRLKKVKQKLKDLGEDPEKLIREIKQRRGRRSTDQQDSPRGDEILTSAD